MADDKTAQGNTALPQQAAKLLSPLDRVQAARAQMRTQAPALAKAAKQAVEVSSLKAAEANKAIRALREAELALAAATEKRASAAKNLADAKTPEATEKAKSALAIADARLEEVTNGLAAATAIEATRTREALAAASAAWDAEKASDAAAAVVQAGERATDPISVFVSRKTGRVYIRQNLKAIHEAPVTFRNPDTPLGTHIYVAMEMGEGGAVSWLAMTYPQSTSGPDSKPRPQRASRRGGRPEPAPSADSGPPRETATGALERIVLADETKAFIADRLWAGASIILSDYPLSPESPVGTEFIVQPN
jgi:hypothetical protein